MLVIDKTQRERFEEAKAVARRSGLVKQFAQQLNFLRTYAEHDRTKVVPQTRVTLGYDFAPHSFSIVWERRQKDGTWKFWFHGGLVLHGAHDGGGNGSAPTFSVSLTPTTGWMVHT